MEIFISAITGLEAMLEKELRALGYTAIRPSSGGVYCTVALFHEVYKLNYVLRTASRILWPISKFACANKQALYKNTIKIDWAPYFEGMPTFAIDVNANHPEFRNSLFAAQVMKDAICDQLREKTGQRPSVDTKHPELRLNLFIENDTAVIAFDTSNRPLHERGYRKKGSEAPLRETLAAGLLMLAGYTKEAVLCDPCCGSGTFLIEAAMMATNTPPQFLKELEEFGFCSHPKFDEEKWKEMRKQVDDAIIPLPPGRIVGVEQDPEIFAVLHASVSRAQFAGKITLQPGDFRKVKLPFQPDFILTNPPYGRRLQEVDELIPLYRALGSFMKSETKKPAKAFLLSGNIDLSKQVGLRTSRRHIVYNGGLECRLLEFDLF